MSPLISEICIVANSQTIGPIYVGDTNKGIFDHISSNLFSARMIITAGMGNTSAPHRELHGPVPIPELEQKQYESYFFTSEMKQQSDQNLKYVTGKGTYIICLIIPAETKQSFRPFEKHVELILKKNLSEIDFSHSLTGQIPDELKSKILEKLSMTFDEINEIAKLAPLFEGNSLFDIGLVASLPEKHGKIAKKIIMHPKGLSMNNIKQKEIVTLFHKAGLVSIEIRDGEEWIIPR